MKVSKSISLLYKFLLKKEKMYSKFSSTEILDATGWKYSTFKTYFIKGQLSDFITEISKDLYEASNIQIITEIEFAKLLSQSKHRRGLGHNCKSKLSKALLRKSRDNMLLALELYNRPSLENKSDVFVMCFCTSWEQLLKAVLIEKKTVKIQYLIKNLKRELKRQFHYVIVLIKFIVIMTTLEKI